MTTDDEDEVDEDDGDEWAMPPYDKRGLRFMAEKCSTCIFRPGNKMDLEPGRVASMLAAVRANDSYVPCHKTLGTGLPAAICRGSDDAHESNLARVARRLGAWYVVTEIDLEKEASSNVSRP